MKHFIAASLATLTVLSLPIQAATPPSPESPVSFKKDVRPLLDDYCLSCHVPGGKGYEKSGFDLRSYAAVMKGTKFGPVVKAGNSQDSTLIVLVEGRADPSINMPYGIKGGLPREKILILRKWIDQGAKDN